MSTRIPRIFSGLLLLVLFSLNVGSTYAQVTNISPAEKADEKKSGGFDMEKLIAHHITDNYRWNIIGNLYFPGILILYSPADGLSVFPSSSFKALGEEDAVKYAGKTVEVPEQMVHGNYIYYPEKSSNRLARVDGAKFYDFSITKNVESIFLSIFVLLAVFITAAKGYTTRKGMAPKGIQSAMEPIIIFVRDEIAKQSIGEKKYKRYVPYLLTVFFFIWLNNLIGLIPIFPGGTNITGNIAVTMTLALLSLLLIVGSSNKHYWAHILWPPGVPFLVKIILVPVELIGVFTKPFALMIRLFANMIGGHIVLISIICLIFVLEPQVGKGGALGVSVGSVAFTVFLYMIKLFVCALQAYIFALLTALFIGQAVEEPAHH